MKLSERFLRSMRAQMAHELQRVHEEYKRNMPHDRGVTARSANARLTVRHPLFAQRDREGFARGGHVPGPVVFTPEQTRRLGHETVRALCQHKGAVPVRTVGLDEELVAWLCPTCDKQLPPDWA